MIDNIISIDDVNDCTLDYDQVLEDSLIDLNQVYKKQPIAIAKGYSQYRGNMIPIPLVSYGDFMCIVGPSKSMKTFLKTALLAGYIGGGSTNYFDDLVGFKSKDKFVIDFDTEQGRFHAQKSSKRIIEMVGNDYEFYKPFSLRKLNPSERLEFIEWIYFESEFRDNIGLVSIDGVADLTDSVNDLEKANNITQKLMKFTADTNSALITILHRNFQTKKPTGHLGSAVLKKAETIMFVDKADGESTVEPEYTRNYPFTSFKYSLNEDVLPYQSDTIF